MSARVRLEAGAKVLLDSGAGVVMSVRADGVEIKTTAGEKVFRRWIDLRSVRPLSSGNAIAVDTALRPWWDGLTDSAKATALGRLEIVLEIVTGYRDGHAELARPEEPFYPFGPTFSISVSARAQEMARILSAERAADRDTARRVHFHELADASISDSSVRRWVRDWKKKGLAGLVDGRQARGSTVADRVDPRFREEAERQAAAFDGDISLISHSEFRRRINVSLKAQGETDLRLPQRATTAYVSGLLNGRGSTTRAQRSTKLRDISGNRTYPAMRPGQVLAIDATRCDNLVYDEIDGRPHSVEILTAIDVASRVVLALRVVPCSANTFEVSLLLYDVLRPFAMSVDDTDVGSWRWAGLPGTIDLRDTDVIVPGPNRSQRIVTGRPLDGLHHIPSLVPDGLRADRGSVNVSRELQAVLQRLGCDTLLNRGGKSNDNAHSERWWETLQRGLQQIDGYKGRNTNERGRLVAQMPLLTARALENHLRQWVALDYHRSWHTGLIVPTLPDARLTPIEAFDAMLEITGRIDMPTRADLLYDFLPVLWLKIGHAGVERKDLTYDAPILDEYRNAFAGIFRSRDSAAPFFYDPNDVSRIWFRDPHTGVVHEVPWRGRDLTDAPMTEKYVEAARRQIRARGGNTALTRRSAGDAILDQLNELTPRQEPKSWSRQQYAARLRVDQSRTDHAEAAAASHTGTDNYAQARSDADAVMLDDYAAWPDLLRGN